MEPNGVLKYYNVRYLEHRGGDSVTTLRNVTKLSVVISVTYTSYLIQVTALILSLYMKNDVSVLHVCIRYKLSL